MEWGRRSKDAEARGDYVLQSARSHLGSSLRRLTSFFFREYCATGLCPLRRGSVDKIPSNHIRKLKKRAETDPHAAENLIREQRKAFSTGLVTPFERDIEVALLIALDTELFLADVC